MMIKFEYIIILTFLLVNITYADNATTEKSENIQSNFNRQCEVAREKKLRPLRDNLVTEYLGKRNSKDYCIRFYSTYGDAIYLTNGSVRPRMFKSLQL